MNLPCHVFLYKAVPDALVVLERYAHSLSGLGYRMPKENREDICFFSGETLFFGTLSREGFCGVYPPTEGLEKELLCIRGDWRIFRTSENLCGSRIIFAKILKKGCEIHGIFAFCSPL